MQTDKTFTAFAGDRRIASGSLPRMIPGVKTHLEREGAEPVLIFEDATGRQVDFDLRGSVEDVLKEATPEPPRAGRGRPRLGVVSREVSLLPRHWEWLEQQQNGISAALRRLVDEARRRDPEGERVRRAREAAGRFMTAMAGDRPGFEEASRALYAGDEERLRTLIRPWPRDVRDHVKRLIEQARGVDAETGGRP
jgi:uncharacterized protein